MYGRKEAGFREEDPGAEELRRRGEGGGRAGPRTVEEGDRRVCGGRPAGVVTNGDVRALSAQPCRVGDHLHKYCLQKAINGSFTCSELAICTFFSGTISLPLCTNSMHCNWPLIVGHGSFSCLVLLLVSWAINIFFLKRKCQIKGGSSPNWCSLYWSLHPLLRPVSSPQPPDVPQLQTVSAFRLWPQPSHNTE